MSIKRNRYLYIALFISITFLFNFTLVKEVVTTLTFNSVFMGDGLVTELMSENGYQNLLSGKDIFLLNNSIVYPFQINTALNALETANSLFYFILRPFVSSYVSTILIVFINFFLSGWLMYVLLRHFRIRDEVAFIVTLAFAFMPFMSHRVLGHYAYTALYLFPLIYLIIFKLFSSISTYTKIIYSFGLGLAMAWTLMVNQYYFFSILLSYVFFGMYLLIYKKNSIVGYIQEYWLATIGSATIFSIVLLPWLKKVYEISYFQEPSSTVGVGSSITLSADVLSFIIPSQYNPLYRFVFTNIIGAFPHSTKLVNFYTDSWNRFAYPGVIFLLSFIGILLFQKHVSKKILSALNPFLFVSTGFILLALGPVLKIMNRWSIVVDEGIAIIFPLPFLIIRYIPILNGLRAPIRFTPAYIFFGLIAGAFALNYAYTKIHKKYILRATLILLVILLVDQWYVIPTQQDQDIHTKIYEYIKQDTKKGTVFEIPYTLRDGLRYIGFVFAITPIKGHLIHGKPTMGGYLPRLQPYIFSYYARLPFMSYIASITDKGNYNPFTEAPQPVVITKFVGTIQDIEREVEFFDIQYITLKSDEDYSELIKSLIIQVGFTKILSEQNSDLYHRPLTQKSFSQIDIGSEYDYLFVIDGLSESKGDYRTTTSQMTRLFIKPQGAKNLIITAKATKNAERASVYLNKKYIKDIEIDNSNNTYLIKLPTDESMSIGELIIKFDNVSPEINLYSIELK